ncbi:MAG: YqjK family protein [Aquabacterium sp.]|nr:YqjK family protein [Aquabacterium sp.]
MFFDARQQALALRRQQLQDRSALLRGRLADDAQVLRMPLALADQVRQGWRWLKANPQWVGVCVALLVVWRPRRLAWLAGRLWVCWRLWQRLHRWRGTLAPVALQLLGAVTGPLAARARSWRSAAPPPR